MISDDPKDLRLSTDFSTAGQTYQEPKFISDLNTSSQDASISLYDFYFNLDVSAWSRFSLDKDLNSLLVGYHHLHPTMKRVHNLYIPTYTSLK